MRTHNFDDVGEVDMGSESSLRNNSIMNLHRRRILKSSLALGAWTLAWHEGSFEFGKDAVAQTIAGDTKNTSGKLSPLEHYLQFQTDGSVDVLTTVTNLGQGTHAAITQIVMEELAMPSEMIRIKHAPVRAEFHQDFPRGVMTYASAGFASAMNSIAPAAAAARQMLIAAAASVWGLPIQECEASGGFVLHRASSKKLEFAKLLSLAAKQDIPHDPKPKTRDAWKVLGHSLARPDIPERVNGRAKFGIDVVVPQMQYAATLHAPRVGARFQDLVMDTKTRNALKRKGVLRWVALPHAVAVVANSFWLAQQVLKELTIRWDDESSQSLEHEAMRRTLLESVRRGQGKEFPAPRWQKSAEAAHALSHATRVIDCEYEAPFLAHTPMEPLNATVEVRQGKAQLWLSTQSQTDTQRAVAQLLGIALEKVTIHTQAVGGGFGRRLEKDFVEEAVLIARESGIPVKLIWSRQDELRAAYFRPMTSMRMRLALGPDMLPTAMRCDMASPSLLQYSNAYNSPAIEGFDWTTIMGLIGTAYNLPLNDLRWEKIDFGVACAYWRSVGNSQNVHFLEHSLEKAARLAKMDSIDYRLRLLQTSPRASAFVREFRRQAKWDEALPEDHFRGFAMNSSGDRLQSAHIVEIQKMGEGRFRLHKIYAAINPGTAANPAAVEHQLLGGTLFGLSAAVFGEVSFKDGDVVQQNFDTYRLMKMENTPPIEVFLLADGGEPQGVGEEGPPSIIAALANALLAASGRPVDRMPVSRSGWQLENA